MPALIKAADQSDPALVILLLRSGAPVDQRDPNGATPLIRASAQNRLAAVRALIASGAEVNARTGRGWTALHHAANHNNGSVIRVLLQAGASTSVRRMDGVSPLQLAVGQACPDAVRELLDGGAVIEKSDKAAVETLLATPRPSRAVTDNPPMVIAPDETAAGGDQPGSAAIARPVFSD
jgi:ankyrin repeat protein